ncbi:MAG TPA: hypothetical protein VJT49_34235 [Amycolatopsis sp.]|uniref:hypothetical protein n=1 Tax=Amycolatopsis sp. TaxID=37632 RepID=UPI002B48DC41|nr:hypothetical protein [Amycolatopsis sp.]HKS50082.1 hypothetical protein [Amycolatopsis sp.]
MNNPADTEDQLRDAFEAFAAGVHPAPDAYRRARSAWRRSERRRRLILAVVIAVVFSLSVLIGLWVLNRAASTSPVLFTGWLAPHHGEVITNPASSGQTWLMISP